MLLAPHSADAGDAYLLFSVGLIWNDLEAVGYEHEVGRGQRLLRARRPDVLTCLVPHCPIDERFFPSLVVHQLPQSLWLLPDRWVRLPGSNLVDCITTHIETLWADLAACLLLPPSCVSPVSSFFSWRSFHSLVKALSWHLSSLLVLSLSLSLTLHELTLKAFRGTCVLLSNHSIPKHTTHHELQCWPP